MVDYQTCPVSDQVVTPHSVYKVKEDWWAVFQYLEVHRTELMIHICYGRC